MVIRHKKNSIIDLFIDGVWCTKPNILQREGLSFFQNLFTSTDRVFPSSLDIT